MLRQKGFTLIELLVVIAIIALLLALLAPALDRAVTMTERARCLVNQRMIVQSCHQYAMDQRRVLPTWKLGTQISSAYDLRGTWNANLKVPLGLGLLPHRGYLPGTQLGKAIHCPSMNNAEALLPGIGMDVKWQYGGGDAEGEIGAGGSWWTDPAWTHERILSSFNYRSTSHENAGKGALKLANAGSSLILTVDLPDLRFGGRFLHPDGYNRVFGDGHGSFFFDPNREVDDLIRAYVDPNGVVAGGPATTPAAMAQAAKEEQYLYPHLETQK